MKWLNTEYCNILGARNSNLSGRIATLLIICCCSVAWADGEAGYTVEIFAPSLVQGWPGQIVEFDAIIQLTEANEPVAGWSFGVTIDVPSECSFLDWTYSNTVSASITDEPPGLFDDGYRQTEETSGPGNEGIVSVVCLDNYQSVVLEPNGTPYSLLRLTFQAQIPYDGSVNVCTLQLVDGLTPDVGPPIETVLVVDFNIVQPEAVGAEVAIASIPDPPRYSGGTGEPNDPYLIDKAYQLNALGVDPNDWGKCFKLTADIDLCDFTGTNFNIIGRDSDLPFTGIFDGNGHVISNFTYDSNDANSVGLFSYVGWMGEIRNLSLEDCSVSGRDNVGGLVGKYEGTISNCNVDGSVTGDYNVGGLVGTGSVLGRMENCGSTGTVSGQKNVGGLAGELIGKVNSSFSTADVVGVENVGGLVGIMSGLCDPAPGGPSDLRDCYANGSVSGETYVGGLVGQADGNNALRNCYSTGTVSGIEYLGGLVGSPATGCPVGGGWCWTNCYWNTETSGQTSSAAGTGLVTSLLLQQSTFEGWDFINVWGNEGDQTYPYLRRYLAGDINEDKSVNFLDLYIAAEQWMK